MKGNIMKKDKHYKSSVIFVVLFFLVTLTGCYGNIDTEKTTTNNMHAESTTNNDSRILIDDLHKIGEYNLYATKLLPNSKLLLCYLTQDLNLCQFKIYDLEKNIILSESKDITVNQFSVGTLTCLKENFYIISNQICYIYNFECELIKQINIPIDILNSFGKVNFWISNDLEKIVYIDNPNLESNYLYVSDTNYQNKKQICLLGDALTITDLFFSSNSKRLGFEGVTIPNGSVTSVECYGYIDMDTCETTMFVDKRIFITHSGDIMIVQSKVADYGIESKGVIKTLDLSTTDKNEFKMVFSDECENATTSPDGDYLLGMHKDYEHKSVVFNVYYKGKAIETIDYNCLPEENYWDFVSSGTEIMLDIETNQILIFYYDAEKTSYTIKAFEF